MSAALAVEVTNRDLENMTLTLTPGVDVSGSVFIEDATTAAASETVSGLDVTQIRVMLRGDSSFGSGSSQPSDTQGSFLIENLLPGEYTVNLNALNRGLYLKRIMVGNLEVAPGDTIAIPPDFNQQIYVLVSPNGGRIDGVALNRSGEPMPNSTITLLPLDMPQTAHGRFTVRGVVETDPDGYRRGILAGRHPAGRVPPLCLGGHPVGTVPERRVHGPVPGSRRTRQHSGG